MILFDRRPVSAGDAEGSMAPPDFGRSVNHPPTILDRFYLFLDPSSIPEEEDTGTIAQLRSSLVLAPNMSQTQWDFWP